MALIKLENVSKIYGPAKTISYINEKVDKSAEIDKNVIIGKVKAKHKDFNPDALTFALENVSLEIEKGEFVAIMGPSGSGKSTLMHLIGLLDTPTTGKLFLNSKNISTHNDNALAKLRRNAIGFVFQSFNLLPRLTALDNVTLPMAYAGISSGQRARRAGKILNAVGLGHRLDHRPNQLSGGQMQRVAIGRALANNPSLILADEPTGNLDSKSGENIMKLLGRLHSKGKTVVIVTHDKNTAAYADRTIRLKDGRVTRDSK